MSNSNLCSEHGEEIDQVVLLNEEVVAYLCPKCTFEVLPIEDCIKLYETKKIDYLKLLQQDQKQIGELCEEVGNIRSMNQKETEEALEMLKKNNEEIEVKIKDLTEIDCQSIDDLKRLDIQFSTISQEQIKLANYIKKTLKLQWDNIMRKYEGINRMMNQMENRWLQGNQLKKN